MNAREFIDQYRMKYSSHPDSKNLYNEAYKVYVHALNNTNKFCIFGRLADIEKILGTPQKIEGKSILAVEGTTLSFYITNEKQEGNVLHADYWTIGVNDAWVLGGIHGESTFNFIFDQATIEGGNLTLDIFIDKYIKSANPAHPTTVTAREILGLKCAGYVPKLIHNTLILTPPSEYVSIDFNNYFTNYDNLKNPDDLIKVIKDYLRPAFIGLE